MNSNDRGQITYTQARQAATSMNQLANTWYQPITNGTSGHVYTTPTYIGHGTQFYTEPLDELMKEYRLPGESTSGCVTRVMAEFTEMKQMLRELAVLTENHGEDTVCL